MLQKFSESADLFLEHIYVNSKTELDQIYILRKDSCVF